MAQVMVQLAQLKLLIVLPEGQLGGSMYAWSEKGGNDHFPPRSIINFMRPNDMGDQGFA